MDGNVVSVSGERVRFDGANPGHLWRCSAALSIAALSGRPPLLSMMGDFDFGLRADAAGHSVWPPAARPGRAHIHFTKNCSGCGGHAAGCGQRTSARRSLGLSTPDDGQCHSRRCIGSVFALSAVFMPWWRGYGTAHNRRIPGGCVDPWEDRKSLPGLAVMERPGRTSRAGAVSGVRWSSLSTIALIVANVAYAAIASRLISPSAFGLMALANLVVLFLQFFTRLGLSALVQKTRP